MRNIPKESFKREKEGREGGRDGERGMEEGKEAHLSRSF